jgi:hypothetical protein
MFKLILFHNVSMARNLEMAHFDGHSDDELMETVVVAAAGLVMVEAINAITAENASGPVVCGLNRFSRGVERLERFRIRCSSNDALL